MDSTELTNGVAIEEPNAGEEGEEQEATLVKKEFKLESGQQPAADEAAGKDGGDDKTEDQVPDINEDPMTTSMEDGIEEIPANEGIEEAGKEEVVATEEQNGELQEPAADEEAEKQPAEGTEDENTEKDVAEIPVNVFEADKPAEEEQPAAEGEETEKPPEDKAEVPVEETEKPHEEAADLSVEEAPKEEEEGEGTAAEATEGESEAQPDGFELQAPPVPKRPRTPNELDEPQQQEDEREEEQVIAVETEAEPVAAEEQVPEAAPPGTPRSTGSRRESGGSKFGLGTEPVTASTPKETPSVASPIPATPPKSGGTATTPKSGRSAKEFDFEQPKNRGRKTTFEDEVLSTKSKSPRSPRSPRTPRTPKTPTKSSEELVVPTAVEEAENAAPPASEPSEEEKQRQASFEERLKERAEEEERWKRVTSWDRGEDEPKPEPVEGEGEEQPKEESVPEADEAQPQEGEGEAEGELREEKVEAEAEQPPAEGQEEGGEPEQPVEEKLEAEESEGGLEPPPAGGDRVEGSPPPPPPRPERSPSPLQRREPASRDYMPYDQDLKQETVPARLPTSTSFSSWVPAEKESYTPISPWVDRSSKYRNEYTVGEPPVAPSAYTAFFDDLVASGPFSSSLYSTSRLLERSRSRTRERRQALRSQSQARNYYRFASQYPAPLRTRDYSSPPASLLSRTPTAASSYMSFMDYAGAKQYEMARSQSLQRSPLYHSNQALSRSASRGGIDYYLGSGRMSRVDSYVDNLHSRYEWNMPSNWETYRASSRGQVGYVPLTNYQSYMGDLQRSLSRERSERDRLRNKYATVSYQLEQACKQMDLLRSHNYSALRSGSAPRTSVYSHFYPYY